MLTLKLLNVNLKRVSLDDAHTLARIARMKEVSVLFKNKRNVLGLVLLGVLIYSTFNIQENSQSLKKLTNLESGIQTCFGRVNQTYTAKLLEDTASQYLTQNFEALTEECFAESILNVDENFKVELANATKKLSTLASNVHWFHEDLIAPNGVKSLANGEGRDLGTRFEKIENVKDEILEETETLKNNITKQLNTGKNIFYVASALLVFIMLLEYFSNTKRSISNNAREIEAERELLDNGGVQSVKMGEIVRMALEQNDLNNCAKLFNNYYIHAAFEKTSKTKNKNPLDALITPDVTPIAVSEENLEKVWNDDTIGIMADVVTKKEPINLDQYITKTIDILSEKLFSKGVQLDVKVDDGIFVRGNDEAIEQIIYHAINFSINNSLESKRGKTVSVNALKLGDLVALDITASGNGFSSELLKGRIGLTSSNETLDLDLQICQSLLSDLDGKMQIDNKISQTGEVVGGRIKLILKAVETPKTAKLVDLKKGSKKDILAQLNF